MRISDIYESDLGRRNYFRDYRDVLLPTVSNALTTAAIYPFFSATMAAYGLPVAGMSVAVLGSAAIGFAVGTLVHNLAKKNRQFASLYSDFTQLVFYRDVLYSVGKRLDSNFTAEYKVSTIDPRNHVNSKLHEVGSQIVRIVESNPDATDSDKAIVLRIKTAYKSPKQLQKKIMEECIVSESALVLSLKAVDVATKYLRSTGTNRTKAAIEKIDKTSDIGLKLIQYRKLQEYVAWDLVEGRIDPKEFYRQTLNIQKSVAAIKESERLLPA